jgi:hypothetical protein
MSDDIFILFIATFQTGLEITWENGMKATWTETCAVDMAEIASLNPFVEKSASVDATDIRMIGGDRVFRVNAKFDDVLRHWRAARDRSEAIKMGKQV